MAGTVTVTRTGNWNEPYAVEVDRPGAERSRQTFRAAPRAQVFALEQAEQHEATLVYNLADSERGGPRRVTAEMMAAAIPKVCAKCRTSKPLADFRVLTRRNATNGVETHFGWADRCEDCEAVHGQ